MKYSIQKEDYNIVDERRLWVHNSIDNDIFEKGNFLYMYTRSTDYTQKGIIKIGETGSLGDERSVKQRVSEQPNSTDTEPLLLLFVLDCKPFVEKGILKHGKELEDYIHNHFDKYHWTDGAGTEWYKVDVDDVIKLIRLKVGDENIGLKTFEPHFLQKIVNCQILDIIDNDRDESYIVAELCARFGKTLDFLELWNELYKNYNADVMILPSYMHSVFTSFGNEILGNFKDEKIGKWTNFSDVVIIDTRDNNWQEKFNKFYGNKRLMIFVSCQTPENSFKKFEPIVNIPEEKRFMLIDEADYGAHTAVSKKLIDYLGKNKIKIVTSGTAIGKAVKILD